MSTPKPATPDESPVPAQATPPAGSSETADLIGASIGKYNIVRKLGEGGMGAVFEALHSEIGQRAAVKVLHPHLSLKPKAVKRFLDEARMISMVGHPGLVKIFDFTKTSDGAQCIVMEFLEGESLWSRFCSCKGTSGVPGLPIPEVVQVIRQVASALAAVHARGIVHRDLKPENIMLVKDPEIASGKRAKILDFGIAKQDQADGEQRQTTAGVVLGTPTYMAPEQIEGEMNPTDRIDVYALGVILFELLSGEPPFQSETTTGILTKHLVKPPPPLPAHVPAELQELGQVMLAKKPTERPSMAKIIEVLDAFGEASKHSTGRVAALPAGSSQVPQRKGLLIAGGLALLAVGLAALLALWPRKPPLPPPAVEKIAAPVSHDTNPTPPLPTTKTSAPSAPTSTPALTTPSREPTPPVRKKPTPKGSGKRHGDEGFRFDDLTKSQATEQ